MDGLRERSCHYCFIRKKMARWVADCMTPVRNGADYCERDEKVSGRAQSTTRYKSRIGHVCLLYLFLGTRGIKGEKSVAYLAAESHDSQGISMPILGYFV